MRGEGEEKRGVREINFDVLSAKQWMYIGWGTLSTLGGKCFIPEPVNANDFCKYHLLTKLLYFQKHGIREGRTELDHLGLAADVFP